MIESWQVIAEMIAMARDMQEAMKRHEALGLNPDEEAIALVLKQEEVLYWARMHPGSVENQSHIRRRDPLCQKWANL